MSRLRGKNFKGRNFGDDHRSLEGIQIRGQHPNFSWNQLQDRHH